MVMTHLPSECVVPTPARQRTALLGGSGRFSERLMAIDDNGHVELLDELRDVRREIDSIPKKSELRLVAYVILGAVGSIFIFRDLIGWLFFLH
jgi:hypothetical protein